MSDYDSCVWIAEGAQLSTHTMSTQDNKTSNAELMSFTDCKELV